MATKLCFTVCTPSTQNRYTTIPAEIYNFLKESNLKGHKDFAEELSRTFYIDTIKTTDRKHISYAGLYSDTKDLYSMLTFEFKENGSFLCHTLLLKNPINPHIKSINCYS